jgi:tetratricopeptide (TPR) repeat protein
MAPNHVARRELSEPDVLVLWARLEPFAAGGLARERLDRALALSDDAAFWFWSGRHHALNNEHGRARRDFEQALQQKPNHPEYLYGLLHLYWQGSGADWLRSAQSGEVTELISALAESANSANHWNAVAAHQVLSDQVDAALESSAEACRLGPDCWACFHNRARALFDSGDVFAARDAEGRALGLLSEWGSAEMVGLVRYSLNYYTRAANGGASDGTAPGLVAP